MPTFSAYTRSCERAVGMRRSNERFTFARGWKAGANHTKVLILTVAEYLGRVSAKHAHLYFISCHGTYPLILTSELRAFDMHHLLFNRLLQPTRRGGGGGQVRLLIQILSSDCGWTQRECQRSIGGGKHGQQKEPSVGHRRRTT